MQGNEVAESSFFECKKLNFHENEKDKFVLKGEFLLSNVSSFCWNILGVSLIVLGIFFLFGLILKLFGQQEKLKNIWNLFLNNKKLLLKLIASLLLYFFLWKYTIAIYLMEIVKISLFTWLNIRF